VAARASDVRRLKAHAARVDGVQRRRRVRLRRRARVGTKRSPTERHFSAWQSRAVSESLRCPATCAGGDSHLCGLGRAAVQQECDHVLQRRGAVPLVDRDWQLVPALVLVQAVVADCSRADGLRPQDTAISPSRCIEHQGMWPSGLRIAWHTKLGREAVCAHSTCRTLASGPVLVPPAGHSALQSSSSRSVGQTREALCPHWRAVRTASLPAVLVESCCAASKQAVPRIRIRLTILRHPPASHTYRCM